MVLTILLLVAPQLFASQKLVLVGGGARPSNAMERFIDFAGGSKDSQIL